MTGTSRVFLASSTPRRHSPSHFLADDDPRRQGAFRAAGKPEADSGGGLGLGLTQIQRAATESATGLAALMTGSSGALPTSSSRSV